MRILHLITRLILGGAQENTLLTVLGQMQAGHEVRLACGTTTGPEGSLVSEALEHGVDYLELPELVRAVQPVDDFYAYHALRLIIRDYRPEVVHTHSSKAGVLGRMAAWQEKVPCVVHTIHGLPFHGFQAWAVNRIFKAAERFAARRCHHMVSVADAMTAQAVAAGIAGPEKFTTVYSGMRMEPFLDDTRDRNPIRDRFGIPRDAFVIAKVARLFELKGHGFLFRAFAEILPDLPHLHLFLVGDGLWRSRLEQEAEKLGIAAHCTFAGLVPHDRVADAIFAADMIAHCSLREGLARVLPQALLSGRPVVSFDVDGAREVVMPDKTGWLVRPMDVAGLARAMREIIADPERARKLASAGREFCRERFDWRSMARKLTEIYEKHLTDRNQAVG